VGLGRGPLSLVSTVEELLERKNSCSGLGSREYGRMDPSRWPRGTFCAQKFANKRGRSGSIVRSQTEAAEFSFYVLF
jgi:hypothetical protein